MKINIIGTIFGQSGYDTHTSNFARALNKIADVSLETQLKPGWEINCPDDIFRMIKSFCEPFDREKISYFVARANLRKELKQRREVTEQEILKEKKKVLKLWDSKADISQKHGNYIHDIMDSGFRGMPVPYHMSEIFNELWIYFSKYVQISSEANICLYEHFITGRIDYFCYRQKNSNVVDLKDIKTNLFNKIRFDSTLIKEGRIKHYDRYMLEPLDYLEDCDYNKMVLQLSTYAYILERQYGLRIGSLEIIHIDTDSDILIETDKMPNFVINRYPVAYMRDAVIKMIEATTGSGYF